jgi:hypothetical protein
MPASLQGVFHSIPVAVWVFSLIASPMIALVAVIVGPLIQLRIAKRQIRSATVSANRQAWINTLRDNLATIRLTVPTCANCAPHINTIRP